MRIISWNELVGGELGREPAPSAMTVGVFDGVHRGHQELVRRVRETDGSLVPTAVTFADNPKRVTAPERFSGMLQTLEQKLETLEGYGIRLCILIDFSGNFSKLGGKEFVSTLVKSGGARFFAIGSDFKCGHKLSTDAEGVRSIAASLGAEVDIVDPVLVEGDKVSSSLIRSVLREGRTDRAFAMLGRPYTLDLRVFDKEVSESVLNLLPRQRGYVLPRAGSYSVRYSAGSVAEEFIATVKDGSITLGGVSDTRPGGFLEFHSTLGYTE